MLRRRLASLALALGLMFTFSGCAAFNGNGDCDDGGGRFFSRFFSNSGSRGGLFHRNGNGNGVPVDCECNGGHMPFMEGPTWTPPIPSGQTVPIPITTTPTATQNPPPPHLFKLPNAAPTPYVPSVN